MEITIENFESEYDLITKSIDRADYLSIDTEFSGLTAHPDDKGNEYDSMESRYQKLRSVINKFVAFQVGITAFWWDNQSKKYQYRPFSFYVWPKSKIQDQSMMFASGSVSFLIGKNFDFNKLFDKGINYARYTDEPHLKKLCKQKVTKNFESVRTYSVLSKSHQNRLEEMLDQIKEFVYDPTTDDRLVFNIQSYALRKAVDRNINDLYVDTGIYADVHRQSTEIVVKKTKKFKQVNFLKAVSDTKMFANDAYYGDPTGAFKEAKLSGKATAATISDAPALGFCDESNVGPQAQKDQLMKSHENPHEELKEGEKTQMMENENELDFQIDQLLKFELGFGRVMRHIARSNKPIIGHNMKFDLAFLFHQFYRELPATLAEFTKQNKDFLSCCYDTKGLSIEAAKLGKSDLQYLYNKATQDKRFNNNLCFEADTQTNSKFGIYEQAGGQGHDAGFDAFMTGLVFASFSKYIEIGNIVAKQPKPEKLSMKEELERQGLPNNKRNRKNIEKEKIIQQENLNIRKIKHFSAVQNKEIYFEDIEKLKNKIMINIEVPQYWDIEQADNLTAAELEYEQKLHSNVVHLQLKQTDRMDHFGKCMMGPSVFEIQQYFTKFGDINIVKDTDLSCFIEFQDVDEEIIKELMTSDPSSKLLDALPPACGMRSAQKLQNSAKSNSASKNRKDMSIAQAIVHIVQQQLQSSQSKLSKCANSSTSPAKRAGMKKGNNMVDEEKTGELVDIVESICLYKDAKHYEYNGESYECRMS